MRHAMGLITRVVLASPLGMAQAATDPAAILSAYRAASSGDAWHGKAVMKTGSKLTGQGLTGTDTSVIDLRHGYSTDHYTLGPASGAQGFDGKSVWRQGIDGAVNIEKGGDALPLALDQAYQNANLWWRPDFGGARVRTVGAKPCGSSTCSALEITPKGGLPFHAWFDQTSHLLERTVQTIGGNTTTITLSDYRDVEGVRIPFETVTDTGHGKQVMDVTARGPAERAGIKAGDVITEVDGKPATSLHVASHRDRIRLVGVGAP